MTLGIAELLTYLALDEPSWIIVLAPMCTPYWVLVAVDIMGILFHAIALYFLIQGFVALGTLKKLEQRLAARQEKLQI